MLELVLRCDASISSINAVDDLVVSLLDAESIQPLDRIAFVAHELVINSIEAMVRTSISPVTIDLKMSVNAESVVFSVNDTAGGLPTADSSDMLEELTEIPETNIIPMGDRGRGLEMIRQLADNFTVNPELDGSFTYTASFTRRTQ